MAVDFEKLYETAWIKTRKKWYEDRGHIFTKYGDSFMVTFDDLPPYSEVIVDFHCDGCGSLISHLRKSDLTRRLQKKSKVYCYDCRGQSQSDGTQNKMDSIDRLDYYKRTINGEIKTLPDRFWTSITTEEKKDIIEYFCEKLIGDGVILSIDELPKVMQKSYNKYKLSKIVTNGIFNLLNEIYPNRWKHWDFSYLSNGYWNSMENRKFALDWFLNELATKENVADIREFSRVSEIKNKFKEYGLSGLVHSCGNSVSRTFLDIYPDKYNEWDFCVKKGFYDKKENKKIIMEWLVKQMFKDNIIMSLEDIPKVAHRDVFTKYRIGSFLKNCFSYSPYDAFNYLYPDRWNYWEFRHVPNNFWDNGRNVSNAIKWVVDNYCKMTGREIEVLKEIPLRKLFHDNLAGLYVKYDIPFLISLIYPDKFSTDDFNVKYKTEDGNTVDSKEEVILHNYFKQAFKNVVYCVNNNKFKFYNEKYNEYYIPDWIIDGNIIVEYFGFCGSYESKCSYILSYLEKMKRKIEYFEGLGNYQFVCIIPSDFTINGFDEVYNKFAHLKSVVTIQ